MMSRIDQMATFLKETVTSQNKVIYTTDELISELMGYFKLKNKNTASKYLEILDNDLRYIEYLPNKHWRVIYCDTELPNHKVSTKPTISIDEYQEQNKSFFLQLQQSIVHTSQAEFENEIEDYIELLKKYNYNIIQIRNKELRE